MTYKVPDNVVNKKLYLSIKQRIDKYLKSQGRRWSLYASGRLVQEYKRQGGEYTGRKNKDGINRWFEEEWIDACHWPKKVPCGRKSVPKSYSQMKKSFPYCRPVRKISPKTPKIVSKYSKGELKKYCNNKYK